MPASKNITHCLVESCQRIGPYVKGLCGMHYQRFLKYGDPLKILNRVACGNTLEDRFWGQVAITANPDRCWIWQGDTVKDGYGRIAHKGVRYKTHRLVWFLTYGYFPELSILHSCDNPPCVNPKHLREGTQIDNMKDRQERDRQRRGRDIRTARLTESDVIYIRQSSREAVTNQQLASRFGVDKRTISAVRCGRSWRHVGPEATSEV